MDSRDVTANFIANAYQMPMLQEQSTVAGGEVTVRALVRISFQLESCGLAMNLNAQAAYEREDLIN